MKFQKLSHLTRAFSCLLLVTCGGTLTLSACATLDSVFKKADSPLPIQVQHHGMGQIMSFRAHETSDRLYVAGLAKRYPLTAPAHVDIQLVGPAGNVIAEKQDDINPLHHAPGGGKRRSDAYVQSS